jgi:ligand-binding sensor protein
VGWANEICPVIKAGESRVICATSQQNLSKKVKENRRPVIDECEAGFSKFLVPIFLRDEFLGSAGGCGCMILSNEIDTFYMSKLLKKDEEEIKKLLSTVPKIPRDTIGKALEYFQERINDTMEIVQQKAV